MSNDKDSLDYSLWIDDAMRVIVKRALEHARDEGLPGKHHFFISFLTYHDGVELSEALRSRYPDEMTVVLQHQFFNLTVSEDGFAVELSFDGARERLYVPFSSIVAFADPSVKFGLQFRQPSRDETDGGGNNGGGGKKSAKREQSENTPIINAGENVISLDKYRNNN